MAAIPDDIDASWIDVSQLDETGIIRPTQQTRSAQETAEPVDWTLPENAKKLEKTWGKDDKELWRFSWLPVGVGILAGSFLFRKFF